MWPGGRGYATARSAPMNEENLNYDFIFKEFLRLKVNGIIYRIYIFYILNL